MLEETPLDYAFVNMYSKTISSIAVFTRKSDNRVRPEDCNRV